jgi:tetratricopeptide (TPR) repeat protein
VIELLLQAERALEMGRIDAAENLYHQVADNDPRNAIAVVGLARVALERGDETSALGLARRALVIDPENAAAGRMVARLEEVLAYRGEALPPRTEAEPAPAEVATAPAEVAAEASAAPVEPRVEAEPTPPAEALIAPLAEAPTTPAPRRRSWLDRLLRRNR